MNNKDIAKMYTIAAFLLGYFLIDNLTSTEQNALGNWLDLVAQTLMTNGSYNFNNDWKNHLNGNDSSSNNSNVDIRSLLNKLNDSLDKVNKIIK